MDKVGGLVVVGSVTNGASCFSYTKTKQTNQQHKSNNLYSDLSFPVHCWDR